MANDIEDFRNMMCLDIYLSSHKSLKDNYLPGTASFKNRFPLHSRDFHSYDQSGLADSDSMQDRIRLTEFAQQHDWNIDINELFIEAYDAIVVTALNHQIQWTSPGFTKMTGYTAQYASGRKPAFLQGPGTTEDVRRSFRNKLNEKRPFREIILNYRKNREEYLCEVKIFPIYNHHNEVVHFIAMEKEAV